MSDKYKYLGINTLIFAISSFGTKILSFLLVPLYTNILSKEEYGVADLITTTASLLIFVCTINIAEGVLRFAINRQNNQKEILSYGIRILIIGSLVCALSLGISAYTKLLNWSIYYYFFIFFYFISISLYQLLTNYLRAKEEVLHVAISGIISVVGIIIANILFLLVFRIGLVGYMISIVIGPLLSSIYAIVVIREPFETYIRNTCDKAIKLEMVSYCIPLVFNNIALWMNAFLDRYFVTVFCGVGENGVYSIASKIPMILATCYTVFSQAWNLSAIKEFDSSDKDGFFSKTYSVYNSLITVVCSILILLNIPLAHFLYAKEFYTAWQYSSVLLLSVMFNSLTIFIGSIFSAVKETKVIAITTVISALVNIILNFILIPEMGAFGASIATVIAYLVMWIVRIILLRKYIYLKLNLFRDCMAYGFLALQVYFEHLENHMYIGQAICFICIIIINYKQILVIIKKILEKVRK